jgi:hypothetical protein
VFSLQGKDCSKSAGNCFQLLIVLFMKECLPTSVLCFLVLIFPLHKRYMKLQLLPIVGADDPLCLRRLKRLVYFDYFDALLFSLLSRVSQTCVCLLSEL